MTRARELMRVAAMIVVAAVLYACVSDIRKARGDGVWKAVLVIIVTSDEAAMGTLIGEFPQEFYSKADCVKFAIGMRPDIRHIITEMVPAKGYGMEVLGHQLACIQVESGDAI